MKTYKMNPINQVIANIELTTKDITTLCNLYDEGITWVDKHIVDTFMRKHYEDISQYGFSKQSQGDNVTLTITTHAKGITFEQVNGEDETEDMPQVERINIDKGEIVKVLEISNDDRETLGMGCTAIADDWVKKHNIPSAGLSADGEYNVDTDMWTITIRRNVKIAD